MLYNETGMKNKGVLMMTQTKYTTVNGIKLPNLILPQDKEIHFGRYAEMHRKYLKEHHKPYYTSLKMQCKLDSHLNEIQTRASEMESRLMKQMAKQEGLTEALKAQNMMAWVQGMNDLKSRVQEIVMTEVIYQR